MSLGGRAEGISHRVDPVGGVGQRAVEHQRDRAAGPQETTQGLAGRRLIAEDHDFAPSGIKIDLHEFTARLLVPLAEQSRQPRLPGGFWSLLLGYRLPRNQSGMLVRIP